MEIIKQQVPKELNALAARIFEANVAKGFYETDKNIGEMLALMHSEISEALEADRKDKHLSSSYRIDLLHDIPDDVFFANEYRRQVKGSFEEEMADILIRVLDMCGFKGIDIVGHTEAKLRYNATREYKHGKKY